MGDSLAFWGLSINARVGRINFGSVPKRSSEDQLFRVKNESAQYTAQAVVISLEDVTADTAAQYLLSVDGQSFAATANLGDLHAQALSPTVWLRRATPSTSATGALECKIRAHATAWVSGDTV